MQLVKADAATPSGEMVAREQKSTQVWALFPLLKQHATCVLYLRRTPVPELLYGKAFSHIPTANRPSPVSMVGTAGDEPA